jgi:hypothetical protein
MIKYWIKGDEYSQEDAEYLTKKKLKISDREWTVLYLIYEESGVKQEK